MKLLTSIGWDLRILARNGICLLYIILTVFYLALLSVLPDSWREKTAVILIFSDPAAMGLFFMGAVILLEKSQRINSALAVSPMGAARYIAAKVFSFCLISVAVAFALALASGINRIFHVLLGTALASMLFSLAGLTLAAKTRSLNQFLLWTVPVEMVCFIPALLSVFTVFPPLFGIGMIAGKGISFIEISGIVLAAALLLAAAHKNVYKMWESMGGEKL